MKQLPYVAWIVLISFLALGVYKVADPTLREILVFVLGSLFGAYIERQKKLK